MQSGLSVHRRRGQLNAEVILLLRDSLRQRPAADRRQPYRRKPRPAVSEQGVLPALALIGGGGRMAHDGFGRGMDTGPVGRDAIERARARQAFKLPLVELARIDPPGEIVKARERPAPLPRRPTIAQDLFATPLPPPQPTPDGQIASPPGGQ